jgi:hypothetical protein
LGTVNIELETILDVIRPHPDWSVRLDVATASKRGRVLVETVDAAMEAANEGKTETWAEDAQLSNDGASVVMVGWEDETALRSWLHEFAEHLASAGIVGTIRPTPVVALWEWSIRLRGLLPTAYVAYQGVVSPDDGQGRDWCDRCAAWAAAAGGTGCIGRVAYDQEAPNNVGAALHASVLGREWGPSASVTHTYMVGAARHVTVDFTGLTIAQEWDPDHTTLDAMRDLLTSVADLARVGFVAVTPNWAYTWGSRRDGHPPLPTMSAACLHHRPELWGRYVTDAHVLQLLTGRHLESVADLSAWLVTEVTDDRFLVEAPDPRSWLQDGGPDDATISRARADFGDAIVPNDAAA